MRTDSKQNVKRVLVKMVLLLMLMLGLTIILTKVEIAMEDKQISRTIILGKDTVNLNSNLEVIE